MIPALRAYILAGGKSRRFGTDKARAEINGVPLVRRVANITAAFAGEVTVVAAAADQYADLGLRTISDRSPRRGPLAGLETALHDSAEQGVEWILLTSCDLLTIQQTWLERLREQCVGPAEFVAFRGPLWEPLIACYRTSLIPRITQQLKEGQDAMWRLLEASQGVVLPLPADWPKQPQANTQAELAAALRQLDVASQRTNF